MSCDPTMKTQLQLTLTVCAVGFGFEPIKARNGGGNQALINIMNDGSKIRENIQNLFNSMARNDTKNSEVYHDILKGELLNERQAFDEMKKDLWIARSRKKRTSYRESNNSGNIVTIKREANEKNDSDAPSSFTLKIPSLPGRSDTFEHIREKKKIYVDKTQYICKLLEKDEKFYFISRPHKFGKSNFLQMLRAFFVGNESLFHGLNIPRNHNWDAYSVIYFNFARANLDSYKKFLFDLSGTLVRTGRSYGIKVKEKRHFEFQLRELILDLSEGKPESVVVLVDEYDRPVRRNYERGRKHLAKEFNECLEDFFELLLSLVESLKMVMVTGLTNIQLMKFSSIVSNFCDITNDPEFNEIMGFTHDEILRNFQDHIQGLADRSRAKFNNITSAIKERYDSYCFSPEGNVQPILNPTSVISCLEYKKVDNYWCRAHTRIPDYIVNFFRENKLTTKYFHNAKVLKKTLEFKYDFNQQIPMEVYMILHGYLTYRGYDAKTELFTVSFPSKEVEETFLGQILDHDSGLQISSHADPEVRSGIKAALISGNVEDFINQVDNLLLKKTPPITQAIVEEYPLTSLMESVLRASAIDVESGFLLYSESDEKEGTALGDIDIETLNLPVNYVMEFKWRKTAAVAMIQLLRYTNTTVFQDKFKGKLINLMGMNFCLDKAMHQDPRHPQARPVRMRDWIKVRYHDGVCSHLEASHVRYLRIFQNLTIPGTNCNAVRNQFEGFNPYSNKN